jgi:hypothetical protein
LDIEIGEIESVISEKLREISEEREAAFTLIESYVRDIYPGKIIE